MRDGNNKTLKTQENEPTYAPHINKKSQMLQREGKIEEILLEDAKRRNQKLNDTMSQKQQEEQQQQAALQSKKSQKLVLNRYLTDFTEYCRN